MHSSRILDLIHWGNNVAARAIGEPTVAYRPDLPWDPLAPKNRFLRIPVLITPVGGGFARPASYGDALRVGIYDASYTQPGDYLVSDSGRWFIAAQDRFLPSLCIETNRVVVISRPGPPLSAGSNGYAGITAGTAVPITGEWPASVLGISESGRNSANLPTDVPTAYWTILLPAIPMVTLRVSDLIVDDLGRNGVIAAAELTRLGWRLMAKDATA